MKDRLRWEVARMCYECHRHYRGREGRCYAWLGAWLALGTFFGMTWIFYVVVNWIWALAIA